MPCCNRWNRSVVSFDIPSLLPSSIVFLILWSLMSRLLLGMSPNSSLFSSAVLSIRAITLQFLYCYGSPFLNMNIKELLILFSSWAIFLLSQIIWNIIVDTWSLLLPYLPRPEPFCVIIAVGSKPLLQELLILPLWFLSRLLFCCLVGYHLLCTSLLYYIFCPSFSNLALCGDFITIIIFYYCSFRSKTFL